MKHGSPPQRYLYKTDGVCPREIKFEIQDGALRDVDFMGGGCPGNATLVGRLLAGLSMTEALAVLGGIDCRNNTSCPDQLARALTAVLAGDLEPTGTFLVQADQDVHKKIAVLAGPQSDARVLERVLEAAARQGAEAVYCLGNLAAPGRDPTALLDMIEQNPVMAVAGQGDWALARQVDEQGQSLPDKARERLLALPQVLSFRLGDSPGMAFFGSYLQELPGYSDFDPWALEINLVCGLADFMRDASVFPALEAMVDQMRARLVLFAENADWGLWRVGEAVFAGVGPTVDGGRIRWGLLSWDRGRPEMQVRTL